MHLPCLSLWMYVTSRSFETSWLLACCDFNSINWQCTVSDTTSTRHNFVTFHINVKADRPALFRSSPNQRMTTKYTISPKKKSSVVELLQSYVNNTTSRMSTHGPFDRKVKVNSRKESCALKFTRIYHSWLFLSVQYFSVG